MQLNVNLIRENWISLIDESIIKQLSQSLFIQKCIHRNISRFELNQFIIQHAFYSKQFTRFICALLSRIKNQHDFMNLIENLNDELGLKDKNSIPHSALYLQMANQLGVKLDQPIHIETQHLIDAMFSYCHQPDPIYGLSALCLGAEAIAPMLYSHIVQGFLQYDVPLQDLTFFTLHIECDDHHADIMRHMLQAKLKASPIYYDTIQTVANDMIKHRISFLDALVR